MIESDSLGIFELHRKESQGRSSGRLPASRKRVGKVRRVQRRKRARKSVKAYRKLSAVLDDGEQADSCPACNKDTGSKRQLQKWILFIVRGGGHIDMWQPLHQ